MLATRFGIATIFLALLAVSSACGGSGNGLSIMVFAAASLSDAFAEMAQEFESRNSGVSVKLNLAGSQLLRSQLELGAKADVFASANTVQMNRAIGSDLIDGSPVAFATSSLAVIASGETGSVRVRSIGDLAAPGVHLVFAHSSVPAGAYARQLLENLSEDDSSLGGDFSDKVFKNVVSEESNVRNVEQKVILGEADAAIVYRPGAERALAAEHVRLIPVPDSYNVVATYPIAVLNDSERPELAAAFVAFVLSDRGQLILGNYGFGPK